MSLTLDGEPVSPDTASYNAGMNYGQIHDAGLEIHVYSFFIARKDLVERFQERYWECSEEIRRDDEEQTDTSPFKEMNYVRLSEAFGHPEQLAKAIRIFFDRDIFEVFLGHNPGAAFVINSTDKISVTENGVTIEGRCTGKRGPST
jgi:hypothetical protein